jgi:hypothetical protein
MTQLRLILLAIFAGLLVSCEEETPLPDNLVNFEATEFGFEGDETEIKLILSRSESENIDLTLSLEATHAEYGTDFTTDPAASGGTLVVTVPAGSTEASFTVIKPANVFFDGDESVDFTLQSAGEPLILGETVSTKLSFTAITSEGSTLTLQGKTDESNYANTVFVDFSANKQTPVDRKSWALGFYSDNDFRVIINHSFEMLIAQVDKTDINSVTVTDAEASKLFNFSPFVPDEEALSLIDSWDGDLSKTAIAAVSATDADNKVYLLATGNSDLADVTTWYKIRVLRNGEGYTLQYAELAATTFSSLDISKSSDHSFVFVSLDNDNDGAIVPVEPTKSNWDIEWAYSTYNSGLNTPYWFQDFVLINHVDGTEAAEVMTSSFTYDAFAEADLSGVTFTSTRDAIGGKWRVTGGPGMTPGIKTDRFYVIKDSWGNVYKLKFVSAGLGDDGGERGRPVVEYKLVKKAG